MAFRVNLPKWGMGIDEGTIVRWLKTVGDRVEIGEPLVEVETAKATQEVESPVSGTLIELLVAQGDVVEINNDIALIEEDDG